MRMFWTIVMLNTFLLLWMTFHNLFLSFEPPLLVIIGVGVVLYALFDSLTLEVEKQYAIEKEKQEDDDEKG